MSSSNWRWTPPLSISCLCGIIPEYGFSPPGRSPPPSVTKGGRGFFTSSNLQTKKSSCPLKQVSYCTIKSSLVSVVHVKRIGHWVDISVATPHPAPSPSDGERIPRKAFFGLGPPEPGWRHCRAEQVLTIDTKKGSTASAAWLFWQSAHHGKQKTIPATCVNSEHPIRGAAGRGD